MQLKELKRGMKCTYRNGTEFIVSSVNDREIEYLDRKQRICSININGDLTHESNENFDIMKVEDITMNGYKTIWERPKDRYYLELPNSDKEMRFLNVHRETGLFSIDVEMNTYFYKTTFTLEEMENLPHQDLIKAMRKVKVE